MKKSSKNTMSQNETIWRELLVTLTTGCLMILSTAGFADSDTTKEFSPEEKSISRRCLGLRAGFEGNIRCKRKTIKAEPYFENTFDCESEGIYEVSFRDVPKSPLIPARKSCVIIREAVGLNGFDYRKTETHYLSTGATFERIIDRPDPKGMAKITTRITGKDIGGQPPQVLVITAQSGSTESSATATLNKQPVHPYKPLVSKILSGELIQTKAAQLSDEQNEAAAISGG